ncbi:hypothetical protein ACFL9T_02055 [Thermodesulfobacteriota bacterium]
MKSKIIIWGLGGVGLHVARMVTQKKSVDLVGVINRAGNKVGRDPGELFGKEKIGIVVSGNADEVLEKEADVVLHHTHPRFEENVKQVSAALMAKKNVISTAAFFYPWKTFPKQAKELDHLAKENGVTLLGGGIFPGFFHYLAAVLTGIVARVDRIIIDYVDDLTTWPNPEMLKAMWGIGLPVDEFNKSDIETNWMAVLYSEAIYFIADYLGWDLSEVRVASECYTSEESIKSVCMEIEPGNVSAFKTSVEGIIDNKVVIANNYYAGLQLEKFEEIPDLGCIISIEGRPPTGLAVKLDLEKWSILSSAAAVVNHIPQVINAPPGLVSMKDLPPPVPVE